MEYSTKNLVLAAAQAILDKKGSNILALEVSHFSSVADFVIIAEGMVDRHVTAIAHEVIKKLEEEFGRRPRHVEGFHSGDWILIDYIDVVIHLFMPGLRENYSLERLWPEALVVDLQLDTGSFITA